MVQTTQENQFLIWIKSLPKKWETQRHSSTWNLIFVVWMYPLNWLRPPILRVIWESIIGIIFSISLGRCLQWSRTFPDIEIVTYSTYFDGNLWRSSRNPSALTRTRDSSSKTPKCANTIERSRKQHNSSSHQSFLSAQQNSAKFLSLLSFSLSHFLSLSFSFFLKNCFCNYFDERFLMNYL